MGLRVSGQKFFPARKFFKAAVGPYLYELARGIIARKSIPRLLKPVTFNDKICHRKLFEHDPHFQVVQDKWLVRKFVEERVGSILLTQMYYCGDDIEAIDFDALPQSFVLKGTHGSGPSYLLFVGDKRELEPEQLRRVAGQILSESFGFMSNEWWYAKIKPQVLVEEMLHDDEYGIPLDYKFFLFHGEVRFVQVDYARYIDHTRTFYDRGWRPQEFTLRYRMGPVTPKPEPLEEMIRIAESIGKDFDFVRIDLYCVNHRRIVFGEITLAPEAGWGRFQPSKWDNRLGAMW
jgi:hypothetical protein